MTDEIENEQIEKYPWKGDPVIVKRVEDAKTFLKKRGGDGYGLFSDLFELTLTGLDSKEVEEMLDKLSINNS